MTHLQDIPGDTHTVKVPAASRQSAGIEEGHSHAPHITTIQHVCK